jgi:hypothetical protein
MEQQGKKFKKGDLVHLRDSVPRMGLYEELGMWNKMRLHGKTGIIMGWAGDPECDDEWVAYQTCYKVFVDGKLETIQEVYIRNVDDIILG